MRTISAALLGVVIWIMPATAAVDLISYSGTITAGRVLDPFSGYDDVSGQLATVGFDVDPTAGTIGPNGLHSSTGNMPALPRLLIGFQGASAVPEDTGDGPTGYANVVYERAGRVVGFTTHVSYFGEVDDFFADFGSPNSLNGWAITLSNGGMSGLLALDSSAPPVHWSDPNHDASFDLAVTAFTVTSPVFVISEAPEPQAWALMFAGFALLGWTVRQERRVQI